jgi:hypothetical protein
MNHFGIDETLVARLGLSGLGEKSIDGLLVGGHAIQVRSAQGNAAQA